MSRSLSRSSLFTFLRRRVLDMRTALEHHWHAGAARQKFLLLFLLVMLLLLGFWYGLWMPVSTYVQQAQENYRSQYRLSRMMEMQSGVQSAVKPSAQSLAAIVTGKAMEKNIGITRINSPDVEHVQLQLAALGFVTAVQWLHELETGQGLQIQELQIDTTASPGIVDIAVTLQSPSAAETAY